MCCRFKKCREEPADALRVFEVTVTRHLLLLEAAWPKLKHTAVEIAVSGRDRGRRSLDLVHSQDLSRRWQVAIRAMHVREICVNSGRHGPPPGYN
jgi:hypothetical protein